MKIQACYILDYSIKIQSLKFRCYHLIAGGAVPMLKRQCNYASVENLHMVLNQVNTDDINKNIKSIRLLRFIMGKFFTDIDFMMIHAKIAKEILNSSSSNENY